MAAQAVLLLLPATVAIALIVFLGYPAYPQRHFSWPQALFDFMLLLSIVGLFAAWRLVVLYLRAASMRGHRVALAFLALGALSGAVGAVSALVHWLAPGAPGVTVGFALLTPAAALVPLAAQLIGFKAPSR